MSVCWSALSQRLVREIANKKKYFFFKFETIK